MRSVTDVLWPPELKTLIFGEKFNQPMDEMHWPPTLQSLTFGDEFDQSIWEEKKQKLGECWDGWMTPLGGGGLTIVKQGERES